jgi:hypothetical protein
MGFRIQNGEVMENGRRFRAESACGEEEIL